MTEGGSDHAGPDAPGRCVGAAGPPLPSASPPALRGERGSGFFRAFLAIRHRRRRTGEASLNRLTVGPSPDLAVPGVPRRIQGVAVGMYERGVSLEGSAGVIDVVAACVEVGDRLPWGEAAPVRALEVTEGPIHRIEGCLDMRRLNVVVTLNVHRLTRGSVVLCVRSATIVASAHPRSRYIVYGRPGDELATGDRRRARQTSGQGTARRFWGGSGR